MVKKRNLKNFNQIDYDLSEIDKEECYFCGFSETVDVHHIIPKYMGGTDEPNNLIFLCPNHHRLIHQRKYFLRLCEGRYLLTDSFDIKKNNLPINYKIKRMREPPSLSIIMAKRNGRLEQGEDGKLMISKKIRDVNVKWMDISKDEDAILT